MSYVSNMSYESYMSYVGRLYELYELCTLFEFFMNDSKLLEITSYIRMENPNYENKNIERKYLNSMRKIQFLKVRNKN